MFLLLVFFVCIFSYDSGHADQSLDLIQVKYSKSLEYFSIEPVWIHTNLNPSDAKLNEDGFYSGYRSASGACTLGNNQLVWEYRPFSTSNPLGYCGASNYGGALTVKVDDKIVMDTIPIGGDVDCYGTPIYKIVINTYNDQLESFIYSDSKGQLDSLFIDFDDTTDVPITFEYIKKHINNNNVIQPTSINEQSWEYKNWSVSSHDNLVRYIARGDTVHGHEFGFIKMEGNCNQDLLWICWSTSKKGLNVFKDKEATICFRVGKTRFQIEIPLLSVVESQSGLTLLSFSNFIVGEKFISLLKKGQKIEVTILAPEELVTQLDIRRDTFSLNGFTATKLKAREFCETLSGTQSERTNIHSQSSFEAKYCADKKVQPDNKKVNKIETSQESKSFFVAKHLENLLSIEDEIVKLETDFQEVTILLSAGILNSKLSEWGEDNISKGNLTREQLFYIMSLSMMKLSALTQAADMNEATVCHIKEAKTLMSMAKGNDASPVNCRQKVYSNELQVRIGKNMYGPKLAEVSELANKWATSVILFSQYSAEIDNYGYNLKDFKRSRVKAKELNNSSNMDVDNSKPKNNKREITESLKKLIGNYDKSSQSILTKTLLKRTVFKTNTHHISYIPEEDTFILSEWATIPSKWGGPTQDKENLASHVILPNLSIQTIRKFKDYFNKYLEWYDINQKNKMRMINRHMGEVSGFHFLYSSISRIDDDKNFNNDYLALSDKDWKKSTDTDKKKSYYERLSTSYRSGFFMTFFKKDVEEIIDFFNEEKIAIIKKNSIENLKEDMENERLYKLNLEIEEKERRERLNKLFN